MNKKIYILPIAVFSLTSILALNSAPVVAASVSSLSNQGTIINEAGETVTLVNVKCSSASTGTRTIGSKEGERDWCSQDVPDVCSKNKVGAAQKVCRNGFTAKIEEYNRTNGGTNVNAISESPAPADTAIPENNISAPASAEVQETVDEVALEKERIRVAQEKLELRKQELEINKRRLEQERQSAN